MNAVTLSSEQLEALTSMIIGNLCVKDLDALIFRAMNRKKEILMGKVVFSTKLTELLGQLSKAQIVGVADSVCGSLHCFEGGLAGDDSILGEAVGESLHMQDIIEGSYAVGAEVASWKKAVVTEGNVRGFDVVAFEATEDEAIARVQAYIESRKNSPSED